MGQSGVAGPLDVAAYVIEAQHRRGNSVDKLQLEKLLYLVQGAHHALWGGRAMRDDFRAYKNGPVIRAVEQTYHDVVPGAAPLPKAVGGHPEQLPESVVETIDLVLEYFGTWTGPNLERFVKRQDSPWKQVRGDLPASAASSDVIPDDLISRWFRAHGVNPNPPSVSAADQEHFNRLAAGDEAALADLL